MKLVYQSKKPVTTTTIKLNTDIVVSDYVYDVEGKTLFQVVVVDGVVAAINVLTGHRYAEPVKFNGLSKTLSEADVKVLFTQDKEYYKIKSTNDYLGSIIYSLTRSQHDSILSVMKSSYCHKVFTTKQTVTQTSTNSFEPGQCLTISGSYWFKRTSSLLTLILVGEKDLFFLDPVTSTTLGAAVDVGNRTYGQHIWDHKIVPQLLGKLYDATKDNDLYLLETRAEVESKVR